MKTFIKINKNRLVILLLILLVVDIVVIQIFDGPLKNEVCSNGIVSFELSKDVDVSTAILNSWDTNAKINAGLSLGFDFLFLTVYSLFIALLIYGVNNRLWKNKAFYNYADWFIILIFIAAFFDIIENIALIKQLLGDINQIWTSVAYYSATIKFTLVLLCVIYLLGNWIVLLFKKLKI